MNVWNKMQCSSGCKTLTAVAGFSKFTAFKLSHLNFIMYCSWQQNNPVIPIKVDPTKWKSSKKSDLKMRKPNFSEKCSPRGVEQLGPRIFHQFCGISNICSGIRPTFNTNIPERLDWVGVHCKKPFILQTILAVQKGN